MEFPIFSKSFCYRAIYCGLCELGEPGAIKKCLCMLSRVVSRLPLSFVAFGRVECELELVDACVVNESYI